MNRSEIITEKEDHLVFKAPPFPEFWSIVTLTGTNSVLGIQDLELQLLAITKPDSFWMLLWTMEYYIHAKKVIVF